MNDGKLIDQYYEEEQGKNIFDIILDNEITNNDFEFEDNNLYTGILKIEKDGFTYGEGTNDDYETDGKYFEIF